MTRIKLTMGIPNNGDVQWTSFLVDTFKVLAGGVVAAWISLWVSGRRQDKDRYRAARHLAIRLIDMFERYAIGCGDAISNNLNNQRDNPYDYSQTTYLPELVDLPQDDAGWRGIEPSFAIEAQTFNNQIHAARSFIRKVGEYGDADDVEDEVNKQAVLLGSASWQLATSLRVKYALPASNPPYDVAALLQREEERQASMRAAREEEHAEFWDAQIAAQDALENGAPSDAGAS
jgi:hypothetical protein